MNKVFIIHECCSLFPYFVCAIISYMELLLFNYFISSLHPLYVYLISSYTATEYSYGIACQAYYGIFPVDIPESHHIQQPYTKLLMDQNNIKC